MAYAVFVAVVLAIVAEACGPDLVFRAYLGRNFWKPALKYVAELSRGLPPEKTAYSPYAGMAPGGGSQSLQKLRDTYRALFPDPLTSPSGALNWPESTLQNLRDIVGTTMVTDTERDEFELLRCKIDLRAARFDDDAALSNAGSCLEAYLSKPRPAAMASEARGWLARTDFLRGKHARAAKFYLDELRRETSNIRRERLLESLRLIQPKAEELDEYFDTPEHALFAANRITNFDDYQDLAGPLIERLEQHQSLFQQGAASGALAISLMRAATRMGAPDSTLRFAERVAATDDLRKTAEYNWLAGIARFQKKDYPGAESALRNVLVAREADSRLKTFAANGLVGVYANLDQHVNELWAAFQAHSFSDAASGDNTAPGIRVYNTELWNTELIGLNFDASYLMDAQMSESELEDYLKRYGNEPDGSFLNYPRKISFHEAVRYAIAVRHARREDYGGSAAIYDELKSPRAARMRQAAELFENTKRTGLSDEQHLEALYEYAAFLSSNEDKIFFNDTLWSGFQRFAFINPSPDAPEGSVIVQNRTGLTKEEAARFDQLDRRLRDEQEEYWRAYQILNAIVDRAGPTPLGKKAAQRALISLRGIRTDRFGRSEEIKSADARLTQWLKQ
jgi:hypothetical protein